MPKTVRWRRGEIYLGSTHKEGYSVGKSKGLGSESRHVQRGNARRYSIRLHRRDANDIQHSVVVVRLTLLLSISSITMVFFEVCG